MASCDDLFQRKLKLDLEKQANDEELARISNIQLNRIPSDDEFRKAQDAAIDNLSDPEINAKAAEGAREAELKKQGKKAKPPGVNIGQDQPFNFTQMARDMPEQGVRDYAVTMGAALKSGSENLPGFKESKLASARQRAETLRDLTDRGDIRSWLKVISDPVPGLAGMLDQVMTVRFVNDTANAAYAAQTATIRDWMVANPGKAVPPEMKLKGFNNFKLMMLASKHYNLIRSQWGYLGQALQGRGFEGPLKNFGDLSPDIQEAIAKVDADMKGTDLDRVAEMQEAADLTFNDLSEEMSFSRVLSAADKNLTDPAAGMEQLMLELNDILVRGPELGQRYDPKKIKYNRFRLGNAFAKDQQLLNERTNFLNVGSNAAMALLGPARTYLEDVQIFQDSLAVRRATNANPVLAWGTELMESSRLAWQVNWEGYGAAARALRDSGKELFVDAFSRGKYMYTSNVDTYGKNAKRLDELVAEIEDAGRGGTRKGFKQAPGEKILSWVNPERHRRWMHASVRLWMYNATGQEFLLQPGFRSLAAADNTAGFAFFNYKLRHDIEMQARLQGDQLNFETGKSPEEAQRAMDDWINEQVNESFYSLQPTEKQIIAFRREQGIAPELMSDQGIADMIVDQRVRETYGGAVPGANPYVQSASDFSSEMRFTKPPEDGLGKLAYDAGQRLRQDPRVDLAFPYFQAPFNGTGLDVTMLPPVAAGRLALAMKDGDKVKIRRMKANMAMSGVIFGIWGGLSASKTIIGNGPSDPEAKRQWRMELEAQGKTPNSIAGIPLPGGFPIFNTMFLMEDIAHNMTYAGASEYDQNKAMNAALGAIAGHLERASALGQVQQLFDIAFGNQQSAGGKVGSLAGYTIAGQFPGTGPMRSIERLSNSQQSDLYRDADWTREDELLFSRSDTEKLESQLRYWAYNFSGLAGVAGGAYKDKDWLGSPIRLQWGASFIDHWKDRFSPKLYPKERVYKVLRQLGALAPPDELISRRLDDIPMDDNLQKEFNDTLGSIRGTTDPAVALKNSGVGTTWTVKLPGSINFRTVEGITVNQGSKNFNLDLSLFLGKHTTGKTVLEAMKSLTNDPMFLAIENDPEIQSNQNVPADQRRKQAAVIMVEAVKGYYAHMTKSKFENEQNPSPSVKLWQERLQVLRARQSQGQMNEAGGAPGASAGAARIEAMSSAINKAQ